MLMESNTITLSRKPKWMRDIQQLLPIRAQFVLSGAIRDNVAFSINESPVIFSFNDTLGFTLRELGYDAVLIWDLVDGLQIDCPDDEIRQDILTVLSMNNDQLCSVQQNQLGGIIKAVSSPPVEHAFRAGLIIDYASRIPDEGRYIEAIKEMYVYAEKTARTANPIGTGISGDNRLFYNPIFWIINRPGDVPFWFSIDNDRIHSISIASPNADTRAEVFSTLYETLDDQLKDVGVEEFSKIASSLTHDMTIRSLQDIVTLLSQMNLPASDVDDAIQCYRVGDLSMDNPWRGQQLRFSIQNGYSILERRVKGQNKALIKVLDVLKRTSIGLTGAQASSSASRPKGVLFFVGPTGVGKTELAKSITELVFGNESAYKRFDMSEFSAEHSADRLIGAPPGYVGYDQGGELTNEMRENPFRVLLFDEIEKAHPLILDKFLQILEDGRLTDGKGETVYFTDALLIFTSNAGVSRRHPDGRVEYLVSPNDERAEFEEKIMDGVKLYFREELRRPELFNRIGENFVIFSFLNQEVSSIILDSMLGNVSRRLLEEQNLGLEISPEAMESLRVICTSDINNGGRGIGAKLEDALINPLARVIFDTEPPQTSTIHVKAISQEDGIYYLDCENSN